MSRFWDSGRAQGTLAASAAIVGLAMLLAACASPQRTVKSTVDPAVVAMYAPLNSEPFRVPSVAVRKVDPRFYRQQVVTPPTVTAEPGTIVVDPQNRFLYLVEGGGMSMRYGIGVGKQGFAWSGEAVIKDKQHWPKWFPPAEMVARDPRAAPYANGMDGGLENPLGARALYLYQGDKDTLYRLHGTSDQASIGRAMSSGCIRLFNQDVIDLYERVPLGTKVVVLGGPQTLPPSDTGYAPPVQVGYSTPAPSGNSI